VLGYKETKESNLARSRGKTHMGLVKCGKLEIRLYFGWNIRAGFFGKELELLIERAIQASPRERGDRKNY